MLISALSKERFLKYHILALFFLVISFVFANITYAESVPVEFSYSEKSTKIIINEKGDYFEVYKDGNLVYSGNEPVYEDNTIKEDGSNYKIGIYKDNVLIDVVNAKSNKNVAAKFEPLSDKNLDSSEINMETAVHNGYLESITTENSTFLNWSKLPDSDNVYEVYRDGNKIGETNVTEFEDSNIQSGERYRYEIIAKLEVSDEKKTELNQELNNLVVKPTIEQNKELYYTNGILSKIVDVPEINDKKLKMKDSFIKGDNENSLAPASLPKSEEYSFEYKTFIPQKAVGDPYSLGNYLIGDNRGYDPFSSKYRTSSVVNVGFWMPYMTHFKDVGLSKRCSNQN